MRWPKLFVCLIINYRTKYIVYNEKVLATTMLLSIVCFLSTIVIDDNHVTRFIQWRCVILIRSKTFFFKWSCNYYTRLCKTHARIHIFISGIIVFGRGRATRCFFHSLNLINVDFFRLGFWPTPCRSAHAKYGVNFLNEANVLTLTTK